MFLLIFTNMKASKFYSKEKYELMSVLNEIKDIGYTSTKEEVEEIEQFFEESKDMNYNTFLQKYKDRYGNIIDQYRESQKIKILESIYSSHNPNGEDRELSRKTLKIVYIAAIIYIATTLVAVGLALVILHLNNLFL